MKQQNGRCGLQTILAIRCLQLAMKAQKAISLKSSARCLECGGTVKSIADDNDFSLFVPLFMPASTVADSRAPNSVRFFYKALLSLL